MLRCLAILLLTVAVPTAAAAAPLTIATWNLEGPAGLEGRDAELHAFGDFVRSADVVVVQEALGAEQVRGFLAKAGLTGWSFAVSDFARDEIADPYAKLEVAVLSRHPLVGFAEFDPYPADDTEAMRAADADVLVPELIPAAQRRNTGARGWISVEVPALKLVVIAAHLKSSQGRTGKADEENSFKREAVAAAIAVQISADAQLRRDWSHVVAGDFNVAPGDVAKVGVDFARACSATACTAYDQTHAILSSGLVAGLAMRNLVVGLGPSYVGGNYAKSPIDNVYATGPIFDRTVRLTAERGPPFGSDHHALRVTVE